MISAQITVLFLLLLLLLAVYLFYLFYTKLLDLRQVTAENQKYSYHLNIVHELLLRDKKNLTLESLLDTLISSHQTETHYDVYAYLVVDKNFLLFKSFINNPVSSDYVRTLQKILLEKLVKANKLNKEIESYTIQEYISGHVLNNSLKDAPKNYFLIPVKFRGLNKGYMAVSTKGKSPFLAEEKDFVKNTVSFSISFLERVQNLTNVGLIRDDYVNNIVHDLRTPLTIISGNADMLIKRNKQLKKGKKIIMYKDIKYSAVRLLNIVNNLLDVAKIESGKVMVSSKAYNIVPIFHEEAERFRSIIEERGIKYLVTVPSKPVVLNFDKDLTSRIIENLISNANKYTQKGSIKVSLEVVKEFVVVQVTDTGVGLKPSEKKHLFSKFEQMIQPADSKAKSTGLGLVISKNLVEAQGGSMSVKSTKGKGSTFSFKLPMPESR
jgi:K+-sensing histidine kinase KdpD